MIPLIAKDQSIDLHDDDDDGDDSHDDAAHFARYPCSLPDRCIFHHYKPEHAENADFCSFP